MLLKVCLILRSALRACPRPELGARLEGRTTVIQLFVSIPSSRLNSFGRSSAAAVRVGEADVFQEGRGKGQRPRGSECCVSFR